MCAYINVHIVLKHTQNAQTHHVLRIFYFLAYDPPLAFLDDALREKWFFVYSVYIIPTSMKLLLKCGFLVKKILLRKEFRKLNINYYFM